MSYTPPISPLLGSWAGQQAYGGATGNLPVSWSLGTDTYIAPVPANRGATVGRPSLAWDQMAGPAGIADPGVSLGLQVTFRDQYIRPNVFLQASWWGDDPYAGPTGSITATWANATYISVTGIDPPSAGEPILFWEQFAAPFGIDALRFGANVYTLYPWEYAPPEWTLDASWVGRDSEYAPPSGLLNGAWTLPAEDSIVAVTGFDEMRVPSPALTIMRAIASPPGFDGAAVGEHNLRLTGVQIRVAGFVASAYGRPLAYNYLQRVAASGFNASAYGAAFVGGGVKLVTPSGLHAGAYGRPTLINTTADQFITGAGRIAPPGVGGPDVSPRSLFPFGIHGSAYGTALVQRTPAPYGFDAMVFGQPSIEYWTKYLHAAGIAPLEPGYPLVFDPTQKVFPSSVARSTVFGDTAVFNQSRFIRVPGEDYFQGSDWAQVESNRRYIAATGLLTTEFGDTNIRNRWPTVAPFGFDAMRPPSDTETGIGYSVRYLRPSGIYRTAYGRPTLTKTPEIAPKGFAGESGTPTVWYKIRRIEANGHDLSRIAEPTIWFRYRHVAAPGFASDSYGATKLEHSTRRLETRGSAFMVLGRPSIQALNRTVSPAGIFEDFATGHMVGTDRWLRPVGYDAARFGTRIIPEIQNLYPQGFTGLYGLPTIWNKTRLIAPAGFLTVGQQPADRWGLNRVFNSDQYITMYFDPDSHLNPPAWPQWTSIENRNRLMRTTGSDMARLGLPQIDNNARQLLPAGILPPDPPAHYQAGMVAYRIRHLRMEGMEPPYLSTWAVVYNDAFVARPGGFAATQFGTASLENTRRYFPYIGGFDVSAYGYPLVADRIRTLEFEGRYTIGAPVVPLPEVKLHTRYVDPQGTDMFGQGWASLSIHWTIITPRWTHQDFFGWADVRNLTPELLTRGRNTEEFGDTFVRLEWRPLAAEGTNMQLFGRSQIADRDRTIPIQGIRSLAFGDKLRVIRLGAPPYSEQTVSLRGVEDDEGIERNGHGIPPPFFNNPNPPHSQQLGEPILNQQVIYVEQEDPSTLFGDARVTANSIRVEPGYWEQLIGEHMVALKVREIIAEPFPPSEVFDPSPARIDPHTIWAVKEAPQQAKDNHPDRRLHYVDERPPPGSGWIKGVGRPTITLYHRNLRPSGINPNANQGLVGRPRVANRRHYIRPEGIRASRFGWHVIPGTQMLEQFASSDMQLFGRPTLAYGPYLGPQTIRPSGAVATVWGGNEIQLLNRTMFAQGFEATRMGTRQANDTPYMWQGLRVGPHVPFIAGGFYSELMGEPGVSFRVREVAMEGFDAFLSEYQLEEFDKRMRVRRVDPPRVREFVEAVGLEHSAIGVPNVRAGVHFIRPDGNADQFRKGAF